MKKISLLGTGLIGAFYAMSLHSHRRKDAIINVCSVHEESAREFSKIWEPVDISDWRGKEGLSSHLDLVDFDENFFLIKKEKMPDGQIKIMLKDKISGKIIQKIIEN